MPARLMALLLSQKRPPIEVGLITAMVLIAVQTVALLPFRGVSGEDVRSVAYLCGVLVISSMWGAWLGVLTAVASAIAFNYFYVAPFWSLNLTTRHDLQTVTVFIVAGLFTTFVANLARSRAVEASERRQEADLAAELAHRMLRADDLRSALGPASQRLAEAFELRSAAIRLQAVPGDEQWAAFPLLDGATPLGTLLIPADAPDRTRERLRQRVVPSLESLLGAAREREEITDSLTRAREEATGLAAEQVSLRRVATLVAHGAAPAAVFDAVTAELCQLLGQYGTGLIRYEPDYTGTLVSGRNEPGIVEMPTGTRLRLDGDCLSGSIRRTGRPAVASYDNAAAGTTAAVLRELGIRSGVGVPVVVEGHLWGAAVVSTTRPTPIPAAVRARLADFTELVAAAIANADSRAQLTASRARIVAATDEARRRLERDLHDGAQQRLISLGLQTRMLQATLPPGCDLAQEELAAIATGLAGVCEELREISRGIHPAMLSKGGLGPALRSLARRSALPVELALEIGRRLPERVEVTMYYVVSEALTNAAKHAQATVVHVDAAATGAILRLSISDDGIGGACIGRGSGLIGLQDRIETVGGRLEIVSPAGSGTTILVAIPIDATGPPAAGSSQ
ncbi:DUF4118 domain-containing protein [Dactylosporangium siamense]|uniref:histidine kinase n=1 Tax=Dactylosporangium siamense TaxID=685454 RepID=A0A919PH41_9ACTN|nr:DUF4118 domain-containing protein [Dactylosporangium siamense]GIG43829.1 hypothetical protein Dsi01nite_018700 [Dactylosporangium siamense]